MKGFKLRLIGLGKFKYLAIRLFVKKVIYSKYTKDSHHISSEKEDKKKDKKQHHEDHDYRSPSFNITEQTLDNKAQEEVLNVEENLAAEVPSQDRFA